MPNGDKIDIDWVAWRADTSAKFQNLEQTVLNNHLYVSTTFSAIKDLISEGNDDLLKRVEKVAEHITKQQIYCATHVAQASERENISGLNITTLQTDVKKIKDDTLEAVKSLDKRIGKINIRLAFYAGAIAVILFLANLLMGNFFEKDTEAAIKNISDIHRPPVTQSFDYPDNTLLSDNILL